MPEEIELDNAAFITINTIGQPGQRVFHLQAAQDTRLITLTIEKEQAAALADTIVEMLEEIKTKYGIETTNNVPTAYDFELREPIIPMFRVGQMGLGYDSDHDTLILLLHELQPEDAIEEPSTVRVSVSREQMRALSQHAHAVVEGGRPICGNCGRPMDPEGHFCPKSNGHKRELATS